MTPTFEDFVTLFALLSAFIVFVSIASGIYEDLYRRKKG
jgi:hypothetical protein